jgi:hypothetical protein
VDERLVEQSFILPRGMKLITPERSFSRYLAAAKMTHDGKTLPGQVHGQSASNSHFPMFEGVYIWSSCCRGNRRSLGFPKTAFRMGHEMATTMSSYPPGIVSYGFVLLMI